MTTAAEFVFVLRTKRKRLVAETVGLIAARDAARHLLTSGEEKGPLEIWREGDDFALERTWLDDGRFRIETSYRARPYLP